MSSRRFYANGLTMVSSSVEPEFSGSLTEVTTAPTRPQDDRNTNFCCVLHRSGAWATTVWRVITSTRRWMEVSSLRSWRGSCPASGTRWRWQQSLAPAWAPAANLCQFSSVSSLPVEISVESHEGWSEHSCVVFLFVHYVIIRFNKHSSRKGYMQIVKYSCQQHIPYKYSRTQAVFCIHIFMYVLYVYLYEWACSIPHL